MRWDLYFKPQVMFDVSKLNPDLFYMATHCAEARSRSSRIMLPWVRGGNKSSPNGTRVCWPAKPHPADMNPQTVMEQDFYFAASPQNMDRVFRGMWQGYLSKEFARTKAYLNHGILGGRLVSLGAYRNTSDNAPQQLRVGRYLWHGYSYSLYRWLTPRHRICSLDNNHMHVRVRVGSMWLQHAASSYMHNVHSEEPWSAKLCSSHPQTYSCECRGHL